MIQSFVQPVSYYSESSDGRRKGTFFPYIPNDQDIETGYTEPKKNYTDGRKNEEARPAVYLWASSLAFCASATTFSCTFDGDSS